MGEGRLSYNVDDNDLTSHLQSTCWLSLRPHCLEDRREESWYPEDRLLMF